MRAPKALFILLLSSPGLILPHAVRAENTVGRYQMVTLPTKPGSFDSRVMILDTADGHLWQWWEAPAIGNSVPSTGITYLGKVTPGSTTSETPPIHRGGPPEPIMPKH